MKQPYDVIFIPESIYLTRIDISKTISAMWLEASEGWWPDEILKQEVLWSIKQTASIYLN